MKYMNKYDAVFYDTMSLGFLKCFLFANWY